MLIAGCLSLLFSGVAAAASNTVSTERSGTQDHLAGTVNGAPLKLPGVAFLSSLTRQTASTTSSRIPPELTLRDAISIALKYHPRLKEAANEVSAMQERVGEAQSYLGPQVFGVAQYLRTTDNGIGNTSFYDPEGAFPRISGSNHDLPSNDFSQSWSTSNNYMSGVALSQFLFDFGRRHEFVAERRFEAQAADAKRQVTELDLIFEVSQRYFAVLQADKLVRVYEQAVEQRNFHLHEAQVKARANLRPQLDVYVTEAEVERAQLHLVDARNAKANAKVALDNALGLSDTAPDFRPADVLKYSPVNETLPPLIGKAFQTRPDLKMLESEAHAMGATVAEFRSDYLPTVNAVAGYEGAGTGLPVVNNFNAGIVITWPIFNSFLTTDQIAEAKFRQQELRYAMEDLRQKIILQVNTAFLNWQASVQRIERAQKALLASRAELELSDQRYQSGLTNIVELEDAERHYTSDGAQYAEALYGYSVAKAAVEQVTGQSLSNA